ncbi:MAG: hypothetical protein IKL78_03510 [Lachnospiraceae bacterium]|nr:hypothetical protein [Lachnospiraceae bacterium]
MKKRLIAMLLAGLLAVACSACSDKEEKKDTTVSDTTDNAEADTTLPEDESVYDTDDSGDAADDGVTDEGNAGEGTEGAGENTTEGTGEESEVLWNEQDVHTYSFDNGYTTKYPYVANPAMGYTITHFENADGKVMDFSYSSPMELGMRYQIAGKTLMLTDPEAKYVLEAWTYGYHDNEFEEDLELTKMEWVSFISGADEYSDGDYYDRTVTDTTISIVFKISSEYDDGSEYEGYAYFIVDSVEKKCYQFEYKEKTDIYDDARALEVIDSIQFYNE